jgi:hypothetical protein
MLLECEARIGRPLVALRQKLLRQRNPIEPIWELVNIHTATMVGTVTEESGAEPDVRLALPSGDVVWIEATHVSARDQTVLKDVNSFPHWIRKEIAAAGVELKNLNIQIDARDPGYHSDVTVPPRNVRRRLKATLEWRRFVREVLATRRGTWQPDQEFNVIVRVSPGSGYTCGPPIVGIPRRPEDHVLYRAIRSKAGQLRSRPNRLEHQPLILSICATHPNACLESMESSSTRMRHAITAALADTSDWGTVALYNYIGPGYRKGLRVSGAEFISAVIVTELREPMEGWRLQHYAREARSQIFGNPEARHRLTASIVEQLRPLRFNHYRYGPQWGEHWQDPLNRSDSQDERRSRDAGSITMGIGKTGVMTIEISTSLLLRVLSGRATAAEAFAEFGDDTWPRLQGAFSEGREIAKIEVVPGDPAARRTQRVKITLGDPVPPVLSVRKKPPEKPDPHRDCP